MPCTIPKPPRAAKDVTKGWRMVPRTCCTATALGKVSFKDSNSAQTGRTDCGFHLHTKLKHRVQPSITFL